ncbi:MAG: DNA-directed RNA polymerase subunit beta', partial [Nitrospirota bacterium]
MAYDAGEISEHARIKVRGLTPIREAGMTEETIRDPKRWKRYTTVGRVIFGEVLPASIPFEEVNKLMTKKEVAKLIDTCYRQAGPRDTVVMLDRIKDIGFTYATRAGISICIDDMLIPAKKGDLIRKAQDEVAEIERQYADGLITNGERYNKVIDIWAHVGEQVANEMMKELGAESGVGDRRGFNPIFMMAESGARGSTQQIRQLGGMRGLMAKPSGVIIETPITANFREGLTVLQYFISTHGARKGLADTALKTANSGYLTRRLVDIAQDVIVSEHDCGTNEGIFVTALLEGGEVIQQLGDRILGRIAAEDVRDPVTGELIVGANEEITEDKAVTIVEAGLDRVKIRSVLTCESRRGMCIRCYGRDLARGKLVELGEPVGVIAAQSIGEPGTQ